ncbi:hypothetical protein L1887_12729 [Cichorium endivia]|nr:hypothetical protein L1887_12729 [Cichorium endivia]
MNRGVIVFIVLSSASSSSFSLMLCRFQSLSPLLYSYTRTSSFFSSNLNFSKSWREKNPTSRKKRKNKFRKQPIKPIINFLFSTPSSFSLYNTLPAPFWSLCPSAVSSL